jgi:hypothetical protein
MKMWYIGKKERSGKSATQVGRTKGLGDLLYQSWKRKRNEELCDTYTSQSIIQVIKSRIMRWAGHVARVGDRRECVKGSDGET